MRKNIIISIVICFFIFCFIVIVAEIESQQKTTYMHKIISNYCNRIKTPCKINLSKAIPIDWDYIIFINSASLSENLVNFVDNIPNKSYSEKWILLIKNRKIISKYVIVMEPENNQRYVLSNFNENEESKKNGFFSFKNEDLIMYAHIQYGSSDWNSSTITLENL